MVTWGPVSTRHRAMGRAGGWPLSDVLSRLKAAMQAAEMLTQSTLERSARGLFTSGDRNHS